MQQAFYSTVQTQFDSHLTSYCNALGLTQCALTQLKKRKNIVVKFDDEKYSDIGSDIIDTII